jgi:hypothetical protein
MSIIHSPYYMELIHSSDFMGNIHPSYFMEIIHSSYFMEIIHSSYLWRLFIHPIYGDYSFILFMEIIHSFLFVGNSGTSPRPCAVHPLLRPVARAGPRRDGKGRRRIAASVFTGAAQQQQKALLNRRRFSDYFTPHSSSPVSSTFKSVCAVMRSFC